MKLKRPEMVEAVLDILDRFPKASDHDANVFFSKLRVHGVKHLRIFPWNVWGPHKVWSQMFYRTDITKQYQIFNKPGDPASGCLWNPRFFKNLERLRDIAANWRIALYVDFGDHCSTNKKLRHKHPLYNNIDGINGMYDTGINATAMWDEIIRKFVGILGTKRIRVPTIIPGVTKQGPKPWYGLGNELYCSKVSKQQHLFGQRWAYPKALLLRKLGHDLPILFSANEYAAHAIRAYVSPEWGTIFKHKDTVRVFHGVDLYEDFEESLKSVKAGRGFAISDDGTNCKDPDRKAICINVDRYCSANKLSVITLVSNIWLYMKTIGHKKCYFHHIEMLGRSVSETYQSLRNLDHKRDLNVFTSVSGAIFGKDIQWKIPKWMRRRFLKKEK